jgi:hypothetical protein
MKQTLTVACIILKSAWQAVSLRSALTALLLAPLGALATLSAAEPVVAPVAPDATFSQIAQPSGFTPDMPKLSDVCMRFFRLDQPGVSAERMLAAGSDFHITRGVWSYIEDKSFIERVRAKGWEFQGTLNFGNLQDPALALRDREGNPIRSNALRDGKGKLLRDSAGKILDDGKSPFRPDMYNPEFRRLYLERANRLVDLGVTSFQRDDPDEAHFDWGDRPQYGKEGRRDAIPDADLLEFHHWARTEIEKHAGRKLTFSVNWHDRSPFMQVFDYRMTEVRVRDSYATKYVISPQSVRKLALEARRDKKLFMLTGQEDVPAEDFRWVWAASYATGNLYIVPWDQFLNVTIDPVTKLPRIPQNKVGRFFIAPEKFADLTGFVRANAQYLDGYEEAAVGGFDLQDTRFGAKPPVRIEGGSGKLSVFIRAKPGAATAPVVIHLVEREPGAPATLRLPTARFFGTKAIMVKLRVPLPYDGALNAKAEKDKNYRSLIRETTLTTTTEGAYTLVPVPALNPWGFLIVEKLP